MAEGDTRTGGAPAVGFEFVGRARELADLEAAVSARPAVVFVEGEAGIGKSRLVAEARTALGAVGIAFLTGMCHPLREPLPYGPVADALRGARASPADPGDAPEAPWTAADPQRTADTVRARLRSAAPAVLVVEDVHWADPATRELLLLIAREPPEDCALVVTYRQEDLPAGTALLGAPYHRPVGVSGADLVLGPLQYTDLATLAASALGRPVPPGLARLLHERSGGLPLIVEEDLITLTHRGRSADPTVQALDTDAVLGVPRSLREIIDERLRRLSPAAAALVHAAAVLGVPAAQHLLQEVAGPGDLDDLALEEALRAPVLHELGPDAYGFAHVLARQAVYESTPGPVRMRAHRRALAALQGRPEPPLVQIAHHTKCLGDTEAWLPRARAAADHAIAVGDLGTAADLLSDILGQHRDLTPEQIGDTARALAGAVRHDTASDLAVAALRRILTVPRLPVPVRAEIRLRLGLVQYNNRRDPAGLAEIEAVLPDLERHNPELAARAMASLAGADDTDFTVAERMAWLERAREVLADTPHRATRAGITMTWLSVIGRQGDQRVTSLLSSLPREDEDRAVVRTTVMALANAAENGILLGQDERAVAWAEEAVPLSIGARAPLFTLGVEGCLVVLTWLGGRWDAWEDGLRSLRTRHPDAGELVSGWFVAVTEGITALARGRYAAAAERFDHLLTADPRNLGLPALAAAAGTARIHLAHHDPDKAWRAVSDYLPLVEHNALWVVGWDLIPVAVETALLRGERATAEDLAARHATAIEGRDAPAAAAEHLLCRGLLLAEDDPVAAAAAFEDAAARWSGIGRPYPAALAVERAAAAHMAEDLGRARVLLDEAASRLDALGAVADAERCRSRARVASGRRTHAPGRAGYGDRLSPREEQVLGLLRHGATNRDVAAALSLSQRTVEHHVAAVLRKLGVRREDLFEKGGPPPAR
ncbi:ATP-binding protein [Kitasatospora sp. NPDC048365]|uniref:ATP-binding protein n=1 Tax=Kitasatospora sp. NPDC048365 TaxID=3364050 RepID=UPI003714C84F